MGILNDITEKLLKFFLSLKEDDWIKWIAQENDWQDNCDKLNNCYFIVKSMPTYPQHRYCQCRLEKIDKPIPNVTAFATCDVRKFTEYLFSDKYKDGKQELFQDWGFTINHSEKLQELFTTQAIQKYFNGDYVYKGVGFNVKIEIVIDIETNNGIVHIKSGWSLYPNGEIKLSTPFSGFANKGD